MMNLCLDNSIQKAIPHSKMYHWFRHPQKHTNLNIQIYIEAHVSANVKRSFQNFKVNFICSTHKSMSYIDFPKWKNFCLQVE